MLVMNGHKCKQLEGGACKRASKRFETSVMGSADQNQ